MEHQVDTLHCSEYPILKELLFKVPSVEPSTLKMPELGKSYDHKPILRCQRTIDKGVYLMVLEDMTMFYVVDDLA